LRPNKPRSFDSVFTVWGLLFGLIIFSACHTQNEEIMHSKINHLIDETSPYLLQHVYNPVEWYPWGDKALALALKEDKPIFLSIGYSSCHWCHVMEKESFENEEIARLMNRLFVNIKVDREERPDIDQKFMRFVQMTTGSGGWPLTVFLTPQGEPFYGGTYFPPENRYGKPGLKKILPVIADFYHHNKTELANNVEKIKRMLLPPADEAQGTAIPDRKNWQNAVEQLVRFYDTQNGGLGGAPKFPACEVFRLFLRYYAHTQNSSYLQMAEQTLQRMASGGIYDQLGGGFARYSVDAHWMVPHFEKMLYDNAQLVHLYLDVFQITQNPFYLRIAQETLSFVLRELTDPRNGGFYSSIDADSEGEEGRFYLWDKAQILQLLGNENGTMVCRYFGVTDRGNFKGHNILFVNRSLAQVARECNKSEQETEQIIEQGKQKLFKRRATRMRPRLDYKILVSWNGLMLSAFAHAYQVTGQALYADAIRKNINFMRAHLWHHSKLRHVFSRGKSKIPAFVDDYAYWIQGLIDAYQALFDDSYLQWAQELADITNADFYDKQNGGYYLVGPKQRAVSGHLKSEQDASLPSATSVMILNQLRLQALANTPSLLPKAEALLKKYGTQALSNPYGFATYLQTLDFYLWQPVEVVIFPNKDVPSLPLLQEVFNHYIPDKVVIIASENNTTSHLGNPLLRNRKAIDGKPTAYVCRGQTCSLPVTKAAELGKLLRSK